MTKVREIREKTVREDDHRFCQVTRAGVIHFRRTFNPTELLLVKYTGSFERVRYEAAIEKAARRFDDNLYLPGMSTKVTDAKAVTLAIEFREKVLASMEPPTT